MEGDFLKAIIFDMDGVIINSEPIHLKLEKELAEELGGTITDEEHSHFIGTTDYYMWSTLKEKFNIELSVDEIVEIKRRKFRENIHQVKLIDNFWDFLIMVFEANYKLALASSNNRQTVDLIIDRFNLDKYLKVAMSGEEVKKGKPDPEIFLTTADKLNIDPSNCIVIEDAENGVAAAKSAGMKCIGLQNPGFEDQDLSNADLVINNFNELDLQVLERLLG